jgi:RNA polymerase sigma-70 factor (ECF subfamily)
VGKVILDTSQTPQTVKLLLKHQGSLYAFIMACVRSFPDADDIWQAVSLATIQAADAPHDDGRFLAWAREIARRRVLEHFRTTRRLIPLDPGVVQALAEAADRVERRVPGMSRREALLECLEKLPPESQQLLAARYDGSSISVAALAQRFGRSEQGVYSLLYRIRNLVRDCVERRMNLEGA